MKFLLAFFFLSTAAFAHDGPGVESDSGFDGPPYESIRADLAALAAKYGQIASVVDYGTSVKGRPLTLIRIGIKTPQKDRGHAVLISGATHGDEFLGVEHRLPHWFLESADKQPALTRYLALGGVVYIVPVLNPDGYEADQRENANDKDLNRDFPLIPENRKGFTQPETTQLATYLEEDLAKSNLQLDRSVDYHCCIGALLFPWSYTNKRIPQKDFDAHETLARGAAKIFGSGFRYGNTGDVLGYYAYGTSKDYWYARLGALAYTFEGEYESEHLYFDKHAMMWELYFGSIGSNQAD